MMDDFNFYSFSIDEVNEAKEEVEKNGVGGYLRYLQQREESWKTVPLNIAVIGNSGVGKSSFINAIRGMTADDEGAAAVGETETTVNIESYSHPNNPCLKFWDLPGVGTPSFPRETYLKEVEVERFDFFLLLSCTRFTENDAWLGEEIKKIGRRYFYVRTKIASDVSNNRKAHPKTHNEEEVISKIRLNTREKLNHDDTPVFLIDSYKPHRYDFRDLEQSLIGDFPKLKRSALLLSMCASSEQIVQLKVKELRSRMWRSALLSAAVAAVPFPGVSIVFDVGIVATQSEFYKTQLGLDQTSLERFSKLTSTNLQVLNEIAAQSGVGATIEGIKFLARNVPAVASSAVIEEFTKFIPFFGSLIAAPLSYGGTYLMLKLILDKLEESALKIVRLTAENMARVDETELEQNDDDDD